MFGQLLNKMMNPAHPGDPGAFEPTSSSDDVAHNTPTQLTPTTAADLQWRKDAFQKANTRDKKKIYRAMDQCLANLPHNCDSPMERRDLVRRLREKEYKEWDDFGRESAKTLYPDLFNDAHDVSLLLKKYGSFIRTGILSKQSARSRQSSEIGTYMKGMFTTPTKDNSSRGSHYSGDYDDDNDEDDEEIPPSVEVKEETTQDDVPAKEKEDSDRPRSSEDKAGSKKNEPTTCIPLRRDVVVGKAVCWAETSSGSALAQVDSHQTTHPQFLSNEGILVGRACLRAEAYGKD